jgi:thioredoxin-like negative regulator of GroEL
MPTLGALVRQFGDRVKFNKVDVDQHDALAHQLGIRALPTLMLYRDGQPVERINMLTRARIETLLTEQLA